MESENSFSITDIFIKLLSLFAIYLIATEILLPMFYPKKSGCGCGKLVDEPNKFFNESDLDAEAKACVAVEMCGTTSLTSGKHVSRSDLYKWKNQIIENAEKIFGKSSKTSLKAPAQKKIKSKTKKKK